MSQSPITIRPRRVDARLTILDIDGELTGNGEDALMEAYTTASEGGAKTIGLSFDNLEYMNSSGIGLLVTLLIRVQRNKQTLLAIGLNDHYLEKDLEDAILRE